MGKGAWLLASITLMVVVAGCATPKTPGPRGDAAPDTRAADIDHPAATSTTEAARPTAVNSSQPQVVVTVLPPYETWFLRYEFINGTYWLDPEPSTGGCDWLGVVAVQAPEDLGHYESTAPTRGFAAGSSANVTVVLQHEGAGTGTLLAQVVQEGAVVGSGSVEYDYAGSALVTCFVTQQWVVVHLPMKLSADLKPGNFELDLQFQGGAGVARSYDDGVARLEFHE